MTKRDLVVAEWQLPNSTLRACWNITRDNRARLVWSNRDFVRILQIYLQYLLSYILKFLICIHAGNPLGQNPAGAIIAPAGISPRGEIPRRHPSSSRVY